MKRRLFFIGDIHCHFNDLCDTINTLKIESSFIVQVGDFGVGFDTFEKDLENLSKCNNFLKERDIILYVVRGNHDNPNYFNEDKFQLSNIHLVKDYTILNLSNHNILCLGGAVSIDKEKKIKDNAFWYNEAFVFNESALNTARNIDIVVSHNAPTYCFPPHMNGADVFFKCNTDADKKMLENEIAKERETLEKAVSILKKNNNIQYFIYSHFHQSKKEMIDGTRFILLNIKELYEIL